MNNRNNFVVAMTVFVFLSMPYGLSSADELETLCGDILGKTSDATGRFDAVQNCILKLAQELDSRPRVPSGAVIAFDRANGCPTIGWSEFTPAAGRFVVGVNGDKFKLPYVGGQPEYKIGGSETHKLDVSEIPSHNHFISTGYGVSWHSGLVGGVTADKKGIDVLFNNPKQGIKRDGGHGILKKVISATGGDQPHNNMPPYIALYFCKKD